MIGHQITMGGSSTEFEIDFGGSSVYYHVLTVSFDETKALLCFVYPAISRRMFPHYHSHSRPLHIGSGYCLGQKHRRSETKVSPIEFSPLVRET